MSFKKFLNYYCDKKKSQKFIQPYVCGWVSPEDNMNYNIFLEFSKILKKFEKVAGCKLAGKVSIHFFHVNQFMKYYNKFKRFVFIIFNFNSFFYFFKK